VSRLALQGSVSAVAVLGGLWAIAPLARSEATVTTIPVSEIKDGMKGYGLTVFKGTEPERFDVEVVGVLKNFRPAQDLILVKTPHPRLNITKNVKGMSGSPIYFNGRLAGAYAYSWASFQVEPVAGVTPIAPMLAEMRRPIPPGFWPLEGAGPLPKMAQAAHAPEPHAELSPTQFRGAPGSYQVDAHVKELAARFSVDPSRSVVPVATPIMVGGVGERTQRYVKTLFEPLGLEPLAVGGGQGSTEGAPLHYVNGGALGVSMVSGDVSFFGLGTVTHVEGSKLCGFGHPMMEAGVTALPTSIGRVHWIFASDQHSSKIGESARPLGALVQDRQSAVVADESKTAPTFSLALDIKGTQGAPKTHWDMNVAEEKFMGPGLVAAALGGALEATTNERRDVTWRLVSKLSIRGYGSYDFEDIGIASGGMPDAGDLARSRLVRTIGEVMNNPWTNAHIEKVEATFHVQYTRDAYTMRGVEIADPIVKAGERARISVRLLPASGPAILRTIEVDIPRDLAGKDAEIELIPGYEAVPEVPAPESLSQLLSNATRVLPPKGLVVQLRLPGQGVTFKTHVAPSLPPFAIDTLRTQNSDVAPEPFANYARTFIPLERFVEGRDKIKIKVRP
jgi:SpoIVB peptidase S55